MPGTGLNLLSPLIFTVTLGRWYLYPHLQMGNIGTERAKSLPKVTQRWLELRLDEPTSEPSIFSCPSLRGHPRVQILSLMS